MKTKLTDSEKLGIVREKVVGSERLRDHLSYLERIPESHGDHTYEWLSGLIDKVVGDDRQRRNQDSLVAAASGKEKPVKVTPARRKKEQEVDPNARTVMPGQPGGPAKPKPKPKPTKGGGKGGQGDRRRRNANATEADKEQKKKEDEAAQAAESKKTGAATTVAEEPWVFGGTGGSASSLYGVASGRLPPPAFQPRIRTTAMLPPTAAAFRKYAAA